MSDIMNHSRDDLNLLPCDTEPSVAIFDEHLRTECRECGHGTLCSPALCSRRAALHRQQLHARLRESVRVLDGASNVIDMAAARRSRR